MLTINTKSLSDKLTDFIRTSVDASGFTRVIVGVSGGIDSSVTLTLATQALGVSSVYPLLLPYGKQGRNSRADARTAIRFVGIPESHVRQVDIEPFLTPLFSHIPTTDKLRRGNAMARMRMIVLFDYSKEIQALVVGTENKTEHLLGYYTRFGDEASDIEPLRGLYKTQVYELAKYLGIPQKIIRKDPTADLWSGQTDEGEFGFTYKDADVIFSLTYDQKLSYEDVLKQGFDPGVVTKVMEFASKNDFKHHLPLIPEE